MVDPTNYKVIAQIRIKNSPIGLCDADLNPQTKNPTNVGVS